MLASLANLGQKADVVCPDRLGRKEKLVHRVILDREVR